MGVDGDQGGRPRIVLAPDHLEHPARLGAIAVVRRRLHLGQHKVALGHLLGVGRRQHQAFLGAPVDGLDPRFAPALAHDAKDPVGALAQLLDHPGLELAGLQLLEAHQQAVAEPGSAPTGLLTGRGQPHRWRVLAGQLQLHEEVAVGIALDHIGDADRRQPPGLGEALAAPAAEDALGLQLLQHQPYRPPVGSLEPEVACDGRDVGLALLADETSQGFAVWNACGLARRLWSGHGASLRRLPIARAGRTRRFFAAAQ